MIKYAIQVENLGKEYIVGGAEHRGGGAQAWRDVPVPANEHCLWALRWSFAIARHAIE